MPERCPACKIIINGGFVASSAFLFSRLTNTKAAQKLAAVAGSARELFQHAMEIGVLSIDHDEQPDWAGCERASKILGWIGQQVDDSEIDAVIAEIIAEMKTVTSGAAREHKHEHDDRL